MTIKPYPEDSVLRRHFESAVEMKRQLWLKSEPTDSVLRRHHQQLHQSIRTSPKVVTERVQKSHKTKTTETNQVHEKKPQPGLFGWLKRVFTG